jgi:hypothetical protein
MPVMVMAAEPGARGRPFTRTDARLPFAVAVIPGELVW